MDRRSVPKNWTTEGLPLKMDDLRWFPKNWTTKGRPPKIGRPKVCP